VSFAQQQHTLHMLKSKVGEAVQGVKAIGKLAMSKVLGRQPVQQAAAPSPGAQASSQPTAVAAAAA